MGSVFAWEDGSCLGGKQKDKKKKFKHLFQTLYR